MCSFFLHLSNTNLNLNRATLRTFCNFGDFAKRFTVVHRKRAEGEKIFLKYLNSSLKFFGFAASPHFFLCLILESANGRRGRLDFRFDCGCCGGSGCSSARAAMLRCSNSPMVRHCALIFESQPERFKLMRTLAHGLPQLSPRMPHPRRCMARRSTIGRRGSGRANRVFSSC